ncbi:hypothetical protein FGG08_007353 [Glutinoglossum americanum]|uniref:Squalene monooxygenase n=1 Tax=Glutinoglossum americanum TaxID=1670608 RepID=A0A9P8HQZ0_9PEZI|nr:hypothetical protein FGG08_007353 [Glutinoglossum americanum]
MLSKPWNALRTRFNLIKYLFPSEQQMSILTDLKPASCKASRDSGGQPYDVLIIGAGILGCAAAVTLARQGRSVVLLERNLKEPDRIVGELLQPGGVAALEKLAMRECLEGIDAVPVKGYEVFYRGESITFWYPPVGVQEGGAHHERGVPGGESGSDGGLKVVASSGRLPSWEVVMKSREMAGREENVKIVEATAKELLKREGSGRVVGVECLAGKEKQCYFAHLTIIADGQASNFRSQYIKHTPIAKSKFWGLKLTDADLPSYGLAYGVIGNGPPILIYQIGTHETRILIDVPNSIYKASSKTGGVKGHIRTNVIPILPKSVQPMVETSLKEGRTAGMVLLGDAMNMRHPLTGSGMTVALNDVVLLGQLLHPLNVPSFNDAGAVLAQMRLFHWKRKEFNASLNILAQALYSLFVADGITLYPPHSCHQTLNPKSFNAASSATSSVAGIVQKNRPV